jgi:signal transduction histidine kinase
MVLALVFTAVLITLQYNRIRYKKKLQALQLQKELQDERARISRDLHDNIGAYTSALIAGIHQLKSDEVIQQTYVDELHDYASNIMGYLRETIWVLNHEQLTLTAFVDRFKTYATRINKYYQHQALQFTTELEGERVLTPQISLNLFRVLQEALQNACKHADASHIHIYFIQQKRMQFIIEDNGKGFEQDRIDQGFGLQNMQARANEIGFQFNIESKQEKGTRILLEEL